MERLQLANGQANGNGQAVGSPLVSYTTEIMAHRIANRTCAARRTASQSNEL